MSDRLFLVPAHGRLVRDPHTKRVLPAGGAWVPDNTFYRRRLRAGDANHGTPPAKVPAALPAAPIGGKE